MPNIHWLQLIKCEYLVFVVVIWKTEYDGFWTLSQIKHACRIGFLEIIMAIFHYFQTFDKQTKHLIN